MRKLFSRIKSSVKKGTEKALEKYIDLGIYLEDKLADDKDLPPPFPEEKGGELSEEEEEILEAYNPKDIDFEGIEDFLEMFIGHLIIGVKSFDEEQELGGIEKLQCSVVSEVFLEDGHLIFFMTGVNGKPKGLLTILPSKYGSFMLKPPDAPPDPEAKYRIYFYGENVLEYIDSEGFGELYFYDKSSASKE